MGKRWRLILDKFAKRRGLTVEFVHPPDSVSGATMEADTQLLYEDEDKWADKHALTEKEDLDLLNQSEASVFYYDGKTGAGTDKEFMEAYKQHKLIFFIRMVPKHKIPHWVWWRVNKRKREFPKELERFVSLVEFKEYLKDTYKP